MVHNAIHWGTQVAERLSETLMREAAERRASSPSRQRGRQPPASQDFSQDAKQARCRNQHEGPCAWYCLHTIASSLCV